MALTPTSSCAFPNELEAASYSLLQEVGQETVRLMDVLSDIEQDIPAIDALLTEGCQIISGILASGDAPALKTCDDVSYQFGLESPVENPIDDSRILSTVGLVLIDGVLYLDGSLSTDPNDLDNISLLRKVYFATGKNLDKTRQVYNDANTNVFYNKQTVVPLNPKTEGQYTTAEIQRLLNDPTITDDDVVARDNAAVVRTESYLTQDQSLSEIERRYHLNENDIIIDVIHKLEANNSSYTINRFLNYGIKGLKLSAALAGEDLSTFSPSVITDSLDKAKNRSATLSKSILDFLSRFSSYTNPQILSFSKRITKEMEEINGLLKTALSDTKFEVTIIKQTDTITRLQSKLSDDQLIMLLEKMPFVSGIYIDAPDETFLTVLNQSNTVGNTTISNVHLNNLTVETPNSHTILDMMFDAYNVVKKIQVASTTKAIYNKALYVEINSILLSIIGKDPMDSGIQQSDQPYQGAISTTSPGALLTRRMDYQKTFAIVRRLGDIDTALEKLSGLFNDTIVKSITAVIKVAALVATEIFKHIQAIFDRLSQQVLPLRQRLDAFMSQYLSLIGNGTFETSLLKCAVNFDIGLSTGLLDDLLVLIDNLSVLVQTTLSKLFVFILDMVENLICKPITILNTFIGDVNLNMPLALCAVPNLNTGTELEKALKSLRFVFTFQNGMLSGYNRDVIKVRTIITSSPEKMSSFMKSTVCNSNAVGDFLATAILNINAGLLSNPIAGLGSAASGLATSVGKGKLF